MKRFEMALIASLLTLVGICCLTYLSFVVFGLATDWPPGDWVSALILPGIVVLYVLVIGSWVIAFFGAPVYAALAQAGRATWITAALLGVLPGIAMLPAGKVIAIPALVCGPIVALATHWACRLSPDNSFKPTPLRDSA